MTTIARKLEKLEQLSKIALRCANCRYSLTETAPDDHRKVRADPRYSIEAKCFYCGTSYRAITGNLNDRELECARLSILSHPRKFYEDERVFAAREWFHASRMLRYIGGEDGAEKLQKRAERARELRPSRRTKAQEQRAARYAELKEVARTFRKEQEEIEEAKYAPHKFPLAGKIKELAALYDNAPAMLERTRLWSEGTPYAVSQEVKFWSSQMEYSQRSAACELVLWGTVLPETQAEIERLNEVDRQRVAEASEAREALEAEKREKEREREALRQSTRPSVNAMSQYQLEQPAPEQAQPLEKFVPFDFPPSPASNHGLNIHPAFAAVREVLRPTLPPNDGSAMYQTKLHYFNKHGEWLTDEQVDMMPLSMRKPALTREEFLRMKAAN